VLILLALFSAASVLLPVLTPLLKRRVFLVAAVVPLVAFVHALVAGPGQSESLEWVPQLGLAIGLRMDDLAWLLVLVVTGVGALVLVYCSKYFSDTEPGLGRFAAILLAFAGAMYGLVLADDVYLLFVLWEATTVFSYLLIGHYTGKKTSRSAALQALLVTTIGGLAMLVGLVILAVQTGTSSIAGIIEAAPRGGLATVAIMLVLAGALSKSAIFPFHFWLPAAMAAPTPVSAYLHAAAMVKAGIYLLARFAPGFADLPGWREVIVVLGVTTMVLGGWTALRQFDLKLLLAYGTVSQLGFLAIVVGYGSETAALAGLALLLAHALFKSTLFLAVGVIDHDAGTRDLRKLSGLGRKTPVLAVFTALALASMAGLPPLFGFVAKEAALTALIEDALAADLIAAAALLGVTIGSILTVAYSVRFFWGAFWSKRDVEQTQPHGQSWGFVSAPVLLSASGLALGLLAPLVSPTLEAYAAVFPHGEHAYHLALWHGLEPALFISLGAIALGAVLFAWRGRRMSVANERVVFSARDAYWMSMRFIDRTAARTTSLTQRGSLPFYLGVIFIVLILTVGTALVVNRSWPDALRPWDSIAQVPIGIVMIIAAIAAARATKRFQAVVLVGVTGLGMSAIFALQGAPDLALTQILVEIVTLVAVVLVLRRLPIRLGARNGTTSPWLRAVIGAAVGITIAIVAVVALGARGASPISDDWSTLAYEIGHGKNVVNVALVDLRGWDTMGELSVLIAAATGVASLIFIRSRADSLPRMPRREARTKARARLRKASASGDDVRSSWLIAGRTLATRNRSILLEVVVRLIFHALIVVSVYLLFAGHNAPGGGFAGGLVVGLALVARYLAGGRHELGAAAPIDAGFLLGSGLVLAAGTAVAPLFFGADALTSTFWEWEVPVLGHLEFVTSTIFDIGVYLVVIGLVLDVLRSLGAEVDKQQEAEEETGAKAHGPEAEDVEVHA
jgi:multicomponent Na+:H+ antiporter subunit A